MKDTNLQVQHSMLVWLKEPNNVEKMERLNAALAEIRNIKGVTQVLFGLKIAEFGGPNQEINYGWTITFENANAVKHYLNHHIHIQAAQIAMSLCTKVIGGFFQVE